MSATGHPSVAERFALPPTPPDTPAPLEAMAHRLQTPEGKKLYALRKHTPIRSSDFFKSALGFRRLVLREIGNVRGAWNLVTTVYNVKRMFVLTLAS